MAASDTARLAPSFTDIRAGDWIDRRVPAAARPYLRLARLDRPIGTWLLVFPCWWSIAMAAPPWPDMVWLMVLFGVGAILMRGAGCTINDILDRDLDRQVERTTVRPIPSGQVSLRQAVMFLIAQMALAFGILIQLTPLAIVLGVASLALVFTYPLMKRITWWPQAYLGLTFNWGAVMGWAAATGSLAWPPLVLYLAGVAWTLGYDTIYAHQDKEDDARIGVKSTARRLGAWSCRFVALVYGVTVAVIAVAGTLAGLTPLFYLGVIAGAAQLVWQVRGWAPDDQADCLLRFRSNRWFGWLILGGVVAGLVPLG